MNAFEDVLRVIIREEVRTAVQDALRDGVPGMVDQAASILGRRRHMALARKLIASGSPDASRVGRRFYVRREAVEAHAAELSRVPAVHDELAELRKQFPLTRRAS